MAVVTAIVCNKVQLPGAVSHFDDELKVSNWMRGVCVRETLGVDLGVEFPQENPLPSGTLWYCGRPFKKLPNCLGYNSFN